jgi:hypothetical protein
LIVLDVGYGRADVTAVDRDRRLIVAHPNARAEVLRRLGGFIFLAGKATHTENRCKGQKPHCLMRFILHSYQPPVVLLFN